MDDRRHHGLVAAVDQSSHAPVVRIEGVSSGTTILTMVRTRPHTRAARHEAVPMVDQVRDRSRPKSE
jgi:hypothetical protein